ncbi:hypothetical protein BDP27DRAFT_1367725 [Rhodocollybia butyracea]|uniref:DUF6532 domain-containing protein n=1 Tax=Rhodocollybia butyracea TaxID=206335 RepID=A0A9P5U3J4_9AGAR|nr:hypothetical protein BDP27DRAFT_1367725 [Rhodocollybia butyracea]
MTLKCPLDSLEKDKLLEKLQQQVKQLEKQTQSQKKTLKNSQEKEKQYEQKKAKLDEEYEDIFGCPAPESEDNYEPENNKPSGNSDEEMESAGFGTPHFPSLVRIVTTITQSPTHPVPRKKLYQDTHHKDGFEFHGPTPNSSNSSPRPNKHSGDSEPGTPPPKVRLDTDGKALAHYLGITKKILASSLCGYESLISHGNMFPSSDIQIGWANEIWEMYCGNYIPEGERPIELTEEMSTMRNINTLKYNKELYLMLSTDFGWYYKNPVARTRMAFIFTLIEHCLTQWKDGYYTSTKLDENISKPVYMQHLTRIGKWISLDKTVTETIRHQWFILANQQLGTSARKDAETKMSNKDRVQAIAELELNTLDAEHKDRELGDTGNISNDLEGEDHMENEGEMDVGNGGMSNKHSRPVSASVVEPKKKKP